MSITSLQSFTKNQLVSLMSTAFAAQSQTNVQDDQAEPLGDIWGAMALAFLVVSQNLTYVNNKSRLLTSGNVSGANPNLEYSPDVDSFVNIFGIYRIAAEPAEGTVTFTPISASTSNSYIQVGTLVQTSTGTQFMVIADTGQSAYTASGYLIPAGSTAAIGVTVQCTTAGVIGNVSANTITSLVSGLGSTTPLSSYNVTNPQAFTNGSAGETDAALATRFQDEFISGRFATQLAISTAIAGAGTDLTYQIGENINPDGSTHNAFFTVFVNVIGSDSSTPSTVLTAVSNAIAAVKALGISYTVVAPALETVNVSAQFTFLASWLAIPGNTYAIGLANAAAAYTAYVNNIGLSLSGTSTLLSYSQIAAVLVTAKDATGVSMFETIGSLTVNSGTSDLTASFGTQFVAGTTTFTHT